MKKIPVAILLIGMFSLVAIYAFRESNPPIPSLVFHNHWQDGWQPSWHQKPTEYDKKVEAYCTEYLAEQYANRKKTPQVKGQWMGELMRCMKKLGYLERKRTEVSYEEL